MRILVIEDEQEIADFVVRGLREEGFMVEHAADGEAAWHAMQRRQLGRRSPGLVAARPGRPDPAAAVSPGRPRYAGALPHRPGRRFRPGARPGQRRR